MSSPTSRYLGVCRNAATSRNAKLARATVVGALVIAPGLACSNNDASVFASAATSTSLTLPAPTTTLPPSSTSESAPPATSSPTTTSTVPPSTASSGNGSLFPLGAEMTVSFSFTPVSGGRINNPYVAVWIENDRGELVKTISLWSGQGRDGARYLSDLRQWAGVSGAAIDPTTSGATRLPGSYTVAWDGTDTDGAAVPHGEYLLSIEAAREHGPYELISVPITIDGNAFSVELPSDGELTGGTAELSI